MLDAGDNEGRIFFKVKGFIFANSEKYRNGAEVISVEEF